MQSFLILGDQTIFHWPGVCLFSSLCRTQLTSSTLGFQELCLFCHVDSLYMMICVFSSSSLPSNRVIPILKINMSIYIICTLCCETNPAFTLCPWILSVKDSKCTVWDVISKSNYTPTFLCEISHISCKIRPWKSLYHPAHYFIDLIGKILISATLNDSRLCAWLCVREKGKWGRSWNSCSHIENHLELMDKHSQWEIAKVWR